jgi:formyltetrahydrofolate-dependent phosphoribosylglycinamide formyltransferase
MRLVVMVSGNGSNLQAILDAISTGELNAQVVLVVSNRREAYGLVRAEKANVPTLYFPLKPFTQAGKPRTAYDAELAHAILPYQPDYVVLAGWMHILSEAFLTHFPRRVINLHPAKYGAFDGTNAIERAYEAYRMGQITESGCMVHYAIPKVDAGEVLAQANVPLYADDTLESFAERMHAQEHRLLVEVLRSLAG